MIFEDRLAITETLEETLFMLEDKNLKKRGIGSLLGVQHQFTKILVREKLLRMKGMCFFFGIKEERDISPEYREISIFDTFNLERGIVIVSVNPLTINRKIGYLRELCDFCDYLVKPLKILKM